MVGIKFQEKDSKQSAFKSFITIMFEWWGQYLSQTIMAGWVHWPQGRLLLSLWSKLVWTKLSYQIMSWKILIQRYGDALYLRASPYQQVGRDKIIFSNLKWRDEKSIFQRYGDGRNCLREGLPQRVNGRVNGELNGVRISIRKFEHTDIDKNIDNFFF